MALKERVKGNPPSRDLRDVSDLPLCIEREGFPGGSVVKNSPANAGAARDRSSIPGSGRSFGVGNGNPTQYSCLENSMDRGTWWAPMHGVSKRQTRLSNWAHTQKTGYTLILQIFSGHYFIDHYPWPSFFLREHKFSSWVFVRSFFLPPFFFFARVGAVKTFSRVCFFLLINFLEQREPLNVQRLFPSAQNILSYEGFVLVCPGCCNKIL